MSAVAITKYDKENITDSTLRLQFALFVFVTPVLIIVKSHTCNILKIYEKIV